MFLDCHAEVGLMKNLLRRGLLRGRVFHLVVGCWWVLRRWRRVVRHLMRIIGIHGISCYGMSVVCLDNVCVLDQRLMILPIKSFWGLRAGQRAVLPILHACPKAHVLVERWVLRLGHD